MTDQAHTSGSAGKVFIKKILFKKVFQSIFNNLGLVLLPGSRKKNVFLARARSAQASPEKIGKKK